MHTAVLAPLILIGGIVGAVAYAFLWRVVVYQKRKFIVKDLKKIKSHFSPTMGLRSKAFDTIMQEMITDPEASLLYDFGFDALSGEPVVGIVDPDAFRIILNDTARFPKLLIETPISSGMVFSEGEVWKHERRRLTPTFHFGALNDAVSYMVAEAEAMNEELVKTAGQALYGRHVFMSVTLRIIIRYAFGEQFDVDWMEVVWKEVMDNFVLNFFNTRIFGRFTKYVPWEKTYNRIHEVGVVTRKLLDQRRKEMRTEATGRNDLIGTLLEAQTNGEDVDDQMIVDEAITFMVAGHETTANLLLWTMSFLCSHPEVQDKAYEEVKEVLGDRPPASEDLKKLRYLRAILDETQRLRGVAPNLLLRQCTEEGK